MADTYNFAVPDTFDLNGFSMALADYYRKKGYVTTVANFGASTSINFDKDTGGINMLLGMGEGIQANCTVSNGMLTINFANAEWTGKIIGLAVGWFLCWIPFVTAIIGCVRQVNLPKSIGSDSAMILSSMVPQQNTQPMNNYQ